MQNRLPAFSFRCFPSTTRYSLSKHYNNFSISYWQLLVLVRFVCKPLVTFGKAEVTRHIGDVSLLHSPLSMWFSLTNVLSPSCIVDVRQRQPALLWLHSYWVGSCWINPYCGSCLSVLIPYHPSCVLTVIALALFIHIHLTSAFIYEI